MKRTALRVDPDKVTDWNRRSNWFRPRTPLKRTPRKARAKIPPTTAAAVSKRCKGRCVVCGGRRALQRHHVLPVQKWPEHEREGLNMVLVCAGDHDNHERAHRRIRFAELPPAVQVWVMTLGGRETLYIERTYRRDA